MKYFCFTFMIIFCWKAKAQPNCNAYLYQGDTLKYEACRVAEKRAGHYQFSRAYQEFLDEALAIDSTFAYAYKVKSTAYLKSGDFVTWKKLIDKAVEHDPEGELFYRGWCRYQFFRDYEGAIADIELLDSLVDYDIGFGQNGDYHLEITRALCYKAIGQPEKAIAIIEKKLSDPSYFASPYDYLHLGVVYLEMGQLDKAIEAFKVQEIENDLAENRYYIAIAYREMNQPEQCIRNLELAKELYLAGSKMFDPYTQHMDKVYFKEIEQAIRNSIH
ncbi:MAG TPA: tetratricopeptide repeat protein [Cryomorphaceae bacterium]|nr:tetratricopeptide repeat protein [Cryomorphaceae bacterium]